MNISLRRIGGLLCYCTAAFFAFVFLACVYRRITHGWGYSAIEDLIVFAIMLLLAVSFGVAGYFLDHRRNV